MARAARVPADMYSRTELRLAALVRADLGVLRGWAPAGCGGGRGVPMFVGAAAAPAVAVLFRSG
jgi:hypothetical protein